jgi:hypothetical protein
LHNFADEAASLRPSVKSAKFVVIFPREVSDAVRAPFQSQSQRGLLDDATRDRRPFARGQAEMTATPEIAGAMCRTHRHGWKAGSTS